MTGFQKSLGFPVEASPFQYFNIWAAAHGVWVAHSLLSLDAPKPGSRTSLTPSPSLPFPPWAQTIDGVWSACLDIYILCSPSGIVPGSAPHSSPTPSLSKYTTNRRPPSTPAPTSLRAINLSSIAATAFRSRISNFSHSFIWIWVLEIRRF